MLSQSELDTASHVFINWKIWAAGGQGLLLGPVPAAASRGCCGGTSCSCWVLSWDCLGSHCWDGVTDTTGQIFSVVVALSVKEICEEKQPQTQWVTPLETEVAKR